MGRGTLRAQETFTGAGGWGVGGGRGGCLAWGHLSIRKWKRNFPCQGLDDRRELVQLCKSHIPLMLSYGYPWKYYGSNPTMRNLKEGTRSLTGLEFTVINIFPISLPVLLGHFPKGKDWTHKHSGSRLPSRQGGRGGPSKPPGAAPGRNALSWKPVLFPTDLSPFGFAYYLGSWANYNSL